MQDGKSILKRIKQVLDIESQAIRDLKVDESYIKAIELLSNTRGRVVLTGMGKAGIIAQKISATMASTGTPSLWLHPAEAVHGDLGRVTRDDVVIALSNSGETEEIKNLLPVIKRIGAQLIAITGNPKSTLAKYSDVVINARVEKEACPFNLAPTASTTAMLAVGDALAIALLELKGFKEDDYALFHPAGTLGKRLLLRVEDIMRKGESHPVVDEDAKVKDVLVKITQARAGSATVVNKEGKLTGVFTDGDLRRWLEKEEDILDKKIKEVMTTNPKVIYEGKLAVEAGKIMQEYKIDELIVVDKNNYPLGLVDIQDLLKVGLI
ncbi:MAG TPA: KpsF/GutQ family sugar-phosphate isomerase [Candidatus Omnitrophica bacterium]|nr:KpsF/GutQ family sugar-phosphate isomerase [Candidatus Omnitrophota bacterium]